MSDALKQAKQSLARAFGDYGQEINTQRAQAAALIALTEQVKRIADALNSIDIVLTNASGAGGAIKIDDGVDR